MSKLVIECSNYDNYTEVLTGSLQIRIINCTSGYMKNVSPDKMIAKSCPYCGNNAIYDQSKGESTVNDE